MFKSFLFYLTLFLFAVSLLLTADFAKAGLSSSERYSVQKHENLLLLYRGGPKYPKGVLLALHGGGWRGGKSFQRINQKMIQFVRPALDKGWIVAYLSYPSGAEPALQEIQKSSGFLKRKYPRMPLCLLGNSAGGHLALTYAGMVSQSRNKNQISCVVANGAPTNIIAFAQSERYKSASRQKNLRDFLSVGFQDSLDLMQQLSPIRFVDTYQSETLIQAARRDPVVSFRHSRLFSSALRRRNPLLYNQANTFAPGFVPFVHTRISFVSWFRYKQSFIRLLDRQTR